MCCEPWTGSICGLWTADWRFLWSVDSGLAGYMMDTAEWQYLWTVDIKLAVSVDCEPRTGRLFELWTADS